MLKISVIWIPNVLSWCNSMSCLNLLRLLWQISFQMPESVEPANCNLQMVPAKRVAVPDQKLERSSTSYILINGFTFLCIFFVSYPLLAVVPVTGSSTVLKYPYRIFILFLFKRIFQQGINY